MKGNKAARNKPATTTHSSSTSTKTKSKARVNTPAERYETEDESDGLDEGGSLVKQKRKPFRLLDLPFELRLRIYEEILHVPQVIDLNPLNFFTILPRLSLLLACRQVHDEASRVFYSQPLYLYPTHGRFFHTKKPLLMRLPQRHRAVINTLAWRMGPGWGSPPLNQNTNSALGLGDCTNLRTLKIFVECDPSDNVFAGFRGRGATQDTYKYFCINLLLGIFEQVPSLKVVEIDAYPSVKKDSPIVLGLRRHIERAGKTLTWGPLRGWDKENDEPGLVGLESDLASMKISSTPMLVEVPA